MKYSNAHLVFFSPTNATREILRNIATGIGVENTKEINLTLPHARQRIEPVLNTNLILFGVPVYEEHIPPVIRPFIENFIGQGQNAIIVAVYGNVGYGLALQEMERLLTQKGFNIIAGAAFIGEHSFSHAKFPIAANRPDDTDKALAIEFGRKVAIKLKNKSATRQSFPGYLPLMSRLLPEGSAAEFAHLPVFESSNCNNCGRCVLNCPVNAIATTTLVVDGSKCLRCFACVRNCPQNARSIKLKHGWLVKRALNIAATHRQEPEFFL